MVDAVAHCDQEGCDWSTGGKNAEGNAAQHAQRTGHTVAGMKHYSFEVTPE
jgi:hypothetical protein